MSAFLIYLIGILRKSLILNMKYFMQMQPNSKSSPIIGTSIGLCKGRKEARIIKPFSSPC